MATTSPNNIRTPDPEDPYNLVPDLAQMAGDVQSALIQRANSYKGTASQRTAFTAAAESGSIWQDTGTPYRIWRKQGGSGGSWQPLVVEEDTGWQDLTLNAPYSEFNSSSPMQYRRIGNRVQLRGRITATSAAAMTSSAIATTLPVGFRPTRRTYDLVKGSTVNYATIDITTSGNVYFYNYMPGSSDSNPQLFIERSWLVG